MALNFRVFRSPAIIRFMEKYFSYADRLVYLGTPVLADVDLIVTSANMKVGAYTVAAQPDISRNITVTHTQVGGVSDTLGTIDIVGTNILDEVITETITPLDETIAVGTKAFKTITSVTGVGWVIDTTADTITVGVGDLLGLPFEILAATNVQYGVLGTALVAPASITVGDIEVCVLSLAAGTYDGSKKAYVHIVN